MSEQQVNPKVLSVVNSSHYNEHFKNGKHHLIREMLAYQELPQRTPTPRANAWIQKPQGRGKFLVQISGGALGGGGW